jgi:hypothetical protein
VRTEEYSDLRTYAAKKVVSEIMLFGKTPAEAKASRMLTVLGAGYVQSIDMVAAALDVSLDRDKSMRHEIAVATAPIDSPIGPIAPGRVVAEGLARNRGVVATAMHCVNAVPYVCRAEPGIKTYLDLPLVCGRAAPSLRQR